MKREERDEVKREMRKKIPKEIKRLLNDEIDEWLFDNFGLLPGCCSSILDLQYNTARMVAEALWPSKEGYIRKEAVLELLDKLYDDAPSYDDSRVYLGRAFEQINSL